MMRLVGGPCDGEEVEDADGPVAVGCWMEKVRARDSEHPDWHRCEYVIAKMNLVAYYRWDGAVWQWVPVHEGAC